MDEPRRYRFRPGAVSFSRTQFTVAIIALLMAAAGVVALVVGEQLIAAGLLGSAGATMGFTTFIARNNVRPPPT